MIEHAIVDSLASAKASAKSNAPAGEPTLGSEIESLGKATLSFFRGGGNNKPAAKRAKGSERGSGATSTKGSMEPIPEPGSYSDRL